MPFKKSFFTLFLCFLPLHVSFASTPKDISFFEDKPKSVAKDFYIYEYLNSEFCSREDAWKLLEHASRMNWKLFHAFASKLDDEGIKKASLCILMKTEELLKD
ncbi:MAG TPA: lytic transglycosylase, partial [Sulfurospirillum sp. UBA11407]